MGLYTVDLNGLEGSIEFGVIKSKNNILED